MLRAQVGDREAFRHLKKRRAWMEKHEDDFHLDNLPTPEVHPSGEELRQLLAIAEISPATRAVLALHFQEDLPIAEVAAILDIPLGTVTAVLAHFFMLLIWVTVDDETDSARDRARVEAAVGADL